MRDAIRWFKCKLKPPKNGIRFIALLPFVKRNHHIFALLLTSQEVSYFGNLKTVYLFQILGI